VKVLRISGEYDLALEKVRTTGGGGELTSFARAEEAWILFFMGQNDSARTILEEILTGMGGMDGGDYLILFRLGAVYYSLGGVLSFLRKLGCILMLYFQECTGKIRLLLMLTFWLH
jgi:hypothetical protein